MTIFEAFAITGSCLVALVYAVLSWVHWRGYLRFRRARRQWGRRIRGMEEQLALIDHVHQDELREQAERHEDELAELAADHRYELDQLDRQLGELTNLHASAGARVQELEAERDRKVHELELELEREKQENGALHDQLTEVRADWTVGVRRVLSRSRANG